MNLTPPSHTWYLSWAAGLTAGITGLLALTEAAGLLDLPLLDHDIAGGLILLLSGSILLTGLLSHEKEEGIGYCFSGTLLLCIFALCTFSVFFGNVLSALIDGSAVDLSLLISSGFTWSSLPAFFAWMQFQAHQYETGGEGCR